MLGASTMVRFVSLTLTSIVKLGHAMAASTIKTRAWSMVTVSLLVVEEPMMEVPVAAYLIAPIVRSVWEVREMARLAHRIMTIYLTDVPTLNRERGRNRTMSEDVCLMVGLVLGYAKAP